MLNEHLKVKTEKVIIERGKTFIHILFSQIQKTNLLLSLLFQTFVCVSLQQHRQIPKSL